MASDVDMRLQKHRLQMSRRALFPFLREETQERHFDQNIEGEPEEALIAVHSNDLQPHATQRIDQLLKRLEERTQEDAAEPRAPGSES